MPKLYVVATPIGNLNDLTPRMKAAIEEADLIAAEDTRVTMKLLNHWDIKKSAVSCHRHNEEEKAPRIVERMLEENLTVALTCDAGTPGISDPGHLLVRACWDAGIPVEPVSGPSATVTALSASGFDAKEFAFYGFLPREKKFLKEKLEGIRRAGIPVFVLYESPHRIVDLVRQIREDWPGCMLCVCSDLTKRYERMYRGTAAQVLSMLEANPSVEKGEYCIVCDISMLPPLEEKQQAASAMVLMLSEIIERDASISEAAQAAMDAGCPRNEVYKAKLKIQEMFEEE